jgi:hypothetical protein
MTSYKIKGCAFRYERSGASEVRGCMFTATPGFGGGSGFGALAGWDVSKNDVCNQTNQIGNKYFHQIHYSSGDHFYDHALLIGWYEHDWYASPIDMPSATFSLPMATRRKFDQEWYLDATTNLLSNFWSGTGATQQFDNIKSTFNTEIIN